MKDILKNINKSLIIETAIYRAGIYFNWFLFALVTSFFIKTELTKGKLLSLLLFIVIVYAIRTGFKFLYKKIANDTYHDIKHNIELNIFEKTKIIKSSNIENLDKEEFANKALEVSYNITKIIFDLIEYIIPCLIGLIVLFMFVNKVSVLLGIVSLIALITMLVFRYNNPAYHEKDNNSNYNDLFKDYILKLETIRKLNIFDFCYKKLNDNKENDIVILKDNSAILYNDLTFSNLLVVYLFVLIIVILLVENNMITAFGYMIALVVIMLKLKKLLYMINPTISNINNTIKNLKDLDKFFEERDELAYFTDWKKITIKDGVYRYLDTNKTIKIPEFELVKGDACGIIGKSGEGKSTLLNVLSGIYKFESGNIFYDGTVDMRYPEHIYISKEVKTLNLVFVSQEVDLFDLSIRDNLCLGNIYTDENLIGLIKEIGLTDWYNSLAKGLDTYIDEKYVVLNDDIVGKINIIRCIVSNKDLLFLDDPSYGMNIESEKEVANMIKKYFKKHAFIIVSHRPIFTTICKKTYFIKDHTLLPKETLL